MRLCTLYLVATVETFRNNRVTDALEKNCFENICRYSYWLLACILTKEGPTTCIFL